MPDYYSVKLNIPRQHEQAIRSLVPEGESVSGTLLALLLGLVDADNPARVEPSDAARFRRIEKRLDTVESRLDGVTALAAGVRR